MDPLLFSLCEFCQRPSFQEEFEGFIRTHCHEFDDADEHPFRYTELYNEFQGRYDAQLSQFLEEHKLDEADFSAHCKKLEDADDVVARHFLNLLVGSASYEAFIKLMREVRDEEQAKMARGHATASSPADGDGSWASPAQGRPAGSEEKGEAREMCAMPGK